MQAWMFFFTKIMLVIIVIETNRKIRDNDATTEYARGR